MRKANRKRPAARTGKPVPASSRISRLASLPDTVGVATRLGAKRLKQTGIPLGSVLGGTGLSVSQINAPDRRVSVDGQIAFLERAARALKDPLLGFHLARDFDLRQIGLLHYTAASSKTLGDALQRMERYSFVVSAGLVAKCSEADNFTVSVRYAGVARHSDRQQMEFLLTTIVRTCRDLTNRRLVPMMVRFLHQRLCEPSEFEKFLGCRIAFGADRDEIVFDRTARQLPVVGADPYLNKILVEFCEAALSHRRSNASPLRIGVENAIAPLLPHGKACHSHVARELNVSQRTLARRLASEGLSFSEIVDQLRADLASRYLGESNLPISQIAWLIGYRGVSGFTHAHKRWTGMTPTEARDRSQS